MTSGHDGQGHWLTGASVVETALEVEAFAAGEAVGVERERERWRSILDAEAVRYPPDDDELPVRHYLHGHRDTIARLHQAIDPEAET